MSKELDLIRSTPREQLLETIQQKQTEREKELAEERKRNQKERIEQKERNLQRSLKQKQARREKKIANIKSGFVESFTKLAIDYFHLDYWTLKKMPKEQHKELAELIAHTAKRKLILQLIFSPILLPLKLLGWLLSKADSLGSDEFIFLMVIGLGIAFFLDLVIGPALLETHHKIFGTIIIAFGLTPCSIVLSGGILKLVHKKTALAENFSEEMKKVDLLSGLKYLYYRSQVRKALGSAGLIKFLEDEARL